MNRILIFGLFMVLVILSIGATVILPENANIASAQLDLDLSGLLVTVVNTADGLLGTL